jgi:hypothetical protein
MACFLMHAMHSQAKIDGNDTSLAFSNATGSAQLLDLFSKKIGEKVELETSLADDGVKFEKIAHWKMF